MAPMKHRLFTKEKRTLIQAGYQVKLCEPFDERYKCPFCDRLMRDPVQTCRGELACAYCYEDARRDDGICPIDGESMTSNEIFRDRAKRNEIGTLECFCLYHDYGCTWKGKVCDVEEHVESCEFPPHTCYMCCEELKPSELKTHLDICDKWSAEKSCIYTGCTYKPENVSDLKSHLKKDVIAHAMLYTAAISNLRKERKSEMDAFTNYTQEKDTKMESNIELLKGQMSLLMKYATDMQNKYDSKSKKLEEKINRLEKDKINQSEKEKMNQSEKVKINQSEKEKMNQSDKENINQSEMDTSESQQLIDSTNIPSFKVMSETVNILYKNISEIELRQNLFENTTYDGKLLWKIDNVSKRMNKAVTGTTTALHSAPVFTSKYGYKFCARLYLNGDGIGKGRHVSLFFVMMKSEYDNLLQWPFNQQITFRLVNQVDAIDDVTETFRDDKKSSSFFQPTKEMNIASGCPLFIKKEELLNGGYIKDDTLYIEISVC